jgi:hypothetical protein
MTLSGMMESIKPIDLPSRTLCPRAGAGPGCAAVVCRKSIAAASTFADFFIESLTWILRNSTKY